MVVISHPTGNTFTRAVLSGLERADANYEFHTSLAVPRDSRWLRHLPGRWQEELGRRTYDIHLSRLHIHPGRELVRLASSALGWRGLSRHEEGFASIDAVCRSLDRAVARRVERGGGVRCVYAFEDAARDTFHAARDRGIRTAYNLPIAYWETSRRLLQEEAARLPEWEPTLGATRDSAEKCGRKTEELTQADIVVCPSEFVARSLPRELRETKQCIVAPFGSPPAVEHAPLPDGGKLRVLFAGSMSQRKGLADVLAAFKLLRRSDVELVVMGTPLMDLAFYRRAFADFRHEPPRPHAAVLALMRTCHLLVLPSIVEGRALVQQEAMSCGLPIVVTPNAGGEDLIEEGRTGFLVPIRAPEAIAERIGWFADHRALLPEMGRAARAKAATFTWQNYWELQRPYILHEA